MGKQSKLRREKRVQQFLNREREDIARKACFWDEIAQRDEDEIGLLTRKMVSETPILKIDNVYQYLRNEMPEFTFMAIEEWSKKLKNSVMPPFAPLLMEFDFIHSGSSVLERSAIHLNLDSGGLMGMFARIKYDGILASIPIIFFKLDQDGNFQGIEFCGEKERMPLTYNPYFAALYTLQLLNCRNVELIDNEPELEVSRTYERYFGQPMTKYKTLRIKKISKQHDSDDPSPYQAIMPLHLRRGNFATYTDDAPLFGKYVGMFWRPATVVGEEKRGIVVKDYKVLAPEKE